MTWTYQPAFNFFNLAVWPVHSSQYNRWNHKLLFQHTPKLVTESVNSSKGWSRLRQTSTGPELLAFSFRARLHWLNFTSQFHPACATNIRLWFWAEFSQMEKKWTHFFLSFNFWKCSKTQLYPFVPKPLDGDLADVKSLKAKMCKFAGV